MTNLHIGRAWGGHAIEDDCPCHQAACGLVDEVSPDCDQHTGRTIRQAHSDDECPVNAYLEDAYDRLLEIWKDYPDIQRGINIARQVANAYSY